MDHDGRVFYNNRKQTLENNQEWSVPVNSNRAYWIISYFEPLQDRSQLSVFVRPPVGSSYLAASFGRGFHVLSDSIKYDGDY